MLEKIKKRVNDLCKKHKNNKHIKEKVIKMKLSGCSYVEIAKTLNVSESSVRYILRNK